MYVSFNRIVTEKVSCVCMCMLQLDNYGLQSYASLYSRTFMIHTTAKPKLWINTIMLGDKCQYLFGFTRRRRCEHGNYPPTPGATGDKLYWAQFTLLNIVCHWLQHVGSINNEGRHSFMPILSRVWITLRHFNIQLVMHALPWLL